MYATDFASKKKQRHVVMKHMNMIITTISQETVVKIGLRTGSTFTLNDSLEEEFKDVKLRGFIKNCNDGEGSVVQYRNIFEGFNSSTSSEARKKWISKEKKRMRDRQNRKKEVDERKKEKEDGKIKKKGKKKEKKKGKKRRIVKVEGAPQELPRKLPRLVPVMSMSQELDEDCKRVGGSDEVEEPLRGGALLFRRRKDRTMVLKEKIDNE